MIWCCSSPLIIRLPGLNETGRSPTWTMVNYVVENRTAAPVQFVLEIDVSSECGASPAVGYRNVSSSCN